MVVHFTFQKRSMSARLGYSLGEHWQSASSQLGFGNRRGFHRWHGSAAARANLGWCCRFAGPLCWLAIAVIGWTQKARSSRAAWSKLLLKQTGGLAAGFHNHSLACYGGSAGEEEGKAMAEHFDSRRFTLLGIKWYHYLWLPILIQLQLTQRRGLSFMALNG
jgi:hypothetical protein